MTPAQQRVDRGVAGLVHDWTFQPAVHRRGLGTSRRLRRLLLSRAAPSSEVIRPAEAAARWSCYFAYLPDGVASAAHRYSLDKLAAEPGRLLVVCAAPAAAMIPREIHEVADALIWKDLNGFDFSGYRLMLEHLAARSPGADLFVMNDSVFGPFASPADNLADAPWDFTGFTASTRIENHIQSYAFQLRRWNAEAMAACSSVFRYSFNRYTDVTLCQEAAFASTAARVMSVGARWFADERVAFNPSLDRGVALAGRDVPFLKRSLVGRHRERDDEEAVVRLLKAAGHPIETA